MTRAFVVLASLLMIAEFTSTSAVVGQESAVSDPKAEAVAQKPIAVKRALIVCGLSGDAEHHKLFADTIRKMHDGLTKRFGFGESDVQILFGDEPQDADTDVIKSAGRATREELEKSVAVLRSKLQSDDALWVIVIGHSHYDGKNSWLNLPGPDIHQLDFAKLFNDINATQQVFVITSPTSGFYLKPLSAKGRVVITSTETDWETNETEFPHEFARVLSTPPDAKDFDIDGDGVTSLFDLYVTVSRNLAQSYLERELLATEHSLLEDNGDGRGTEVQIDFLTPEQGGRAKPKKGSPPQIKLTSDGMLSKSIILSFSRAEPTPTAASDTAK